MPQRRFNPWKSLVRGILVLTIAISTAVAILLADGGAPANATAVETSAAKGAASFDDQCARCHGEDGDGGEGLAPPLIGVFGRRVAGLTDFPYSDALKAKGGVWTEAALDTYVADPQAFAPGASMDDNDPDPAERKAIIEYLKTLK
jgi:cytochrome c